MTIGLLSMTDTRSGTVSVVERTRAGGRRRRDRGRAFSRAHRGLRARRRSAAVCRAERRSCVAWTCMAAPSLRRPATAHASSAAATTARWSRRTWDQVASLPPMRSTAGSIMWRSGRTARWRGRPARRRTPKARPCASSKRLRRSADSPFCRRAFASLSPITTAPRSGSRMRRKARRNSSNGRARISALP